MKLGKLGKFVFFLGGGWGRDMFIFYNIIQLKATTGLCLF